MRKFRVYLASVNNRFGTNVHLPYSVGLLWAYAKQFDDITERYELCGLLYDKEPLETALAKLENPDVLALSSYIWNHRWNLAFATAVHKRWPLCRIIMGGPHVPNTLDNDWFRRHPQIHFLIHGEGEAPFAELLRSKFFSWNVAGVSRRDHQGDVLMCGMITPPDPSEIPSPYLTGVFDELMPLETGWQAPQETHRGCPYRCFAAGTTIAFPDRTVILGITEDSGDVIYQGNQDCVRIKYSTGYLTVTPTHPIFILKNSDEIALPANELKPGDSLIWWYGGGLTTPVIRVEPAGTHDVYDVHSCPDHVVGANGIKAANCTFCQWGASYYQKIREFDIERVEAEFEWFAKHKIEYIENCDANYGVFPRDIDMTKRMIAVKERTGYPKRFRAAFAKNSGDRVFEISKMLHDAGMHKATTVALQSMDDKVLVNIKRKNIRDATAPLLKRYEDAGIPTYSELILGLPGETLNTFKLGVAKLLDAGQHSALFIYNCVQLPNTPFSDSGYIEKYGIQYTDMQAMLLHATPEPGAITEIQPTVTATVDMPHHEWIEGWLFAWSIHTFHCLGLTRILAQNARDQLTYNEFYDELLKFAEESRGTVINQIYTKAKNVLTTGLSGGSWDLVDSRFGSISWPPDEFAFLHAVLSLDTFYDELRPWALRWCSEQACDDQRDAVVRPGADLEAYARELVWYSRKGVDKRLRLKYLLP